MVVRRLARAGCRTFELNNSRVIVVGNGKRVGILRRINLELPRQTRWLYPEFDGSVTDN